MKDTLTKMKTLINKPKKDLKEFIAEKKSYYKSIGRVHCKILNSDVHFNTEGFNHLIYKSNRKKRNVNEVHSTPKCNFRDIS